MTYILANQHNCNILPCCEFFECLLDLFDSCFWKSKPRDKTKQKLKGKINLISNWPRNNQDFFFQHLILSTVKQRMLSCKSVVTQLLPEVQVLINLSFRIQPVRSNKNKPWKKKVWHANFLGVSRLWNVFSILHHVIKITHGLSYRNFTFLHIPFSIRT